MVGSPPKRNKKHRERVAHIPMFSDMRNRIAARMHMAVSNLQITPTKETANDVAKQLAIMTGAIDYMSPVNISNRQEPECKAIVAALASMVFIEKRHEEKGVWGVTGDEINSLKSAAARFDEVLKTIPANVYEATEIFVEQALKPHF